MGISTEAVLHHTFVHATSLSKSNLTSPDYCELLVGFSSASKSTVMLGTKDITWGFEFSLSIAKLFKA